MIKEIIRPPQTTDQKELDSWYKRVCEIINNRFTSSYSGKYPLRLGDYYVWVDSTGDLRIKSSEPGSDADGTIIGTQS